VTLRAAPQKVTVGELGDFRFLSMGLSLASTIRGMREDSLGIRIIGKAAERRNPKLGCRPREPDGSSNLLDHPDRQ